MKQFSYCDSIERILISEKIDCDALIVSNQTLQSTMLFHSELLNTFTDSLVKSSINCIIRQLSINMISNKFKNIKINLSKINLAFTVYQWLLSTKKYIIESSHIKNLKLPKYIKLYSTNSNSFIFVNKRLLVNEFDDIFQISMDPEKLLGIYTNNDSSYSIIIYKDYYNNTYKISYKFA